MRLTKYASHIKAKYTRWNVREDRFPYHLNIEAQNAM